mgnify:FL=1
MDLECVRNNSGKDVMVFLYSDEVETIKPKNPKNKVRTKVTPQAQASKRARETAFASDTYGVIIGAEFFECFEIDLTRVSPTQNRYLNSANAPIVAIISKEGKITSALFGNQITEARVVSAMSRNLMKDKINLSSVVRAADSALGKVYNYEKSIYSQNKAFESNKKMFEKKKTASNKRKMDQAKALV